MRLIDLKKAIDFYLENGNNYHLEVVIPNNKHQMGATSATKLKGVSVGFDWNTGRFFLLPENKMQEINSK